MSPNTEAIYPIHANEPIFHKLIDKSFVSMPSAGMRSAPEILVLELFREVFYDKHYGETVKARDLNPGDELQRYLLSIEERAVLYALQGRRKQTKQSKEQKYFAPAYPRLAEYGWLRKKSERGVYHFLLSGPIAQHIWFSSKYSDNRKNRQDYLVKLICNSLLGNNNPEGNDILAATLGPACFEINMKTPQYNLETRTKKHDALLSIKDDELAKRITEDLVAICVLESKIPRMQWLQLLMTFLRFALPMWLLAQMQITKLVYDWLILAVDQGAFTDKKDIVQGLSMRNRGLLTSTLIPTRQLYEHIDQYMKSRVKLNILLYYLEFVKCEDIDGKKLDLDGVDPKTVGIEKLLSSACDASDRIKKLERYKQIADGLDIQTFITREGEQCAAWRKPRGGGVGKNIDEFFRVLYREELGDEAGGYLLTSEGRGPTRGFSVFPGQLLLKTITYLASMNKEVGMLVLQDVEDHFGQYGIDFSTSADARPRLMKELQSMGLLTGSPDAGSSVTVACPYPC